MSQGPEQVERESKDVLGGHAQFFREKFPHVLSEGRVDCEKLKQALGEEAVVEGERYNFTWAGKSGVFDAISRATTRTLRPDKEESVDFEDSNHIFIEGENLETLKVLQKSYYGQVKMIYIDPPYNTGKDFVYNDNFRQTKKEEGKASGNVDKEGNLKRGLVNNTGTKGHYHSNWLNMMYPRLFLARNLLRDDGVIFVSIDDNEVHNLRMIMNEIFGEENGLVPLIWELPRGINAGNIARAHEYILVYAKNREQLPHFNRLSSEQEYSIERCNKKIDERHPASELQVPAGIRYEGEDQVMEGVIPGSEEIKIKDKLIFEDGELKEPATLIAGWTMKDKFNEWLENGVATDLKGQKIVDFFFKDNGRLYSKKELDVLSLKSVLKNMGDAQEGRKDLAGLFDTQDIIDYPKPVKLIKNLAKLITEKSDTVLDFFTGSGTTHHAVMKQNAEDGGNRQCISVQLAEETDEDSEAREAGYENIAEIACERIRRAAEQIKEEHTGNEDFDPEEFDDGFKSFRLADSNFNHWRAEDIEDEEVLQQKLEDAIETKGADARELAMLYEIMLKLGIELTAEIKERDEFNLVEDTVICLSEDIDEDLIESVVSTEPQVAVFLEAGFGSDELKTNTALQLKDAEIELKVI